MPQIYLVSINDSFNESSLNAPSGFYHVEASKSAEGVAVAVLLIGVFGNSLGILAFLCHPMGRSPLVIDRIVGLLFFTGLVATLISTPMHLYAYAFSSFPADSSLCQIQGLLLNLLCLASVWYSAVLATERFCRLVSPHEHRLTFSPLNLNVIIAGVFVLLIVEVSGPIYGWAEYGYLRASAVCLLDPASKHIFTYSVIHISCYVTLPILVIICFSSHIIHEALRANVRLSNGSQVLKNPKNSLILCTAMLLSMALLLPYHVVLLVQALLVSFTVQEKLIAYWLHIIAMTCVYPVTLFTLGFKEIIPVFKFLLDERRHLQPSSGKISSVLSSSSNIGLDLRHSAVTPEHIMKKEGADRGRKLSLSSTATEFTSARSELPTDNYTDISEL